MCNCWISLFLNTDILQDSSCPVAFSFQIPSLMDLLHSDELNFKSVSPQIYIPSLQSPELQACISG